ncbi:MAG: HAD-IA family hydrolase [Verrucomicrobia bacterium]|nr:HAD-IA family hydrolase [Verrucomicrobiota bacterium]
MKKILSIFLTFATLLGTANAAVKSVVFDFGGVLAQPDQKILVDYLAESLGESPETIQQLEVKELQWIRVNDEEWAFWQKYAASKGKTLPNGWRQEYQAVKLGSVRELEGMGGVLEDLRKEGYHLEMLSNFPAWMEPLIDNLGYRDRFDHLYLSYQTQVEKPSAEAYVNLLDDLSLQADEILFIDDQIANVEAAKKLGIDAIHFTSVEQLKKELAAKKGLALFYWDARPLLGFSNFGDALSAALIERMIRKEVAIAQASSQGKLLGMGSILNYAKEGDIVWGTGVNGKSTSYRFSNLDVRAVRGPLTRDFLLKRGIACPEVYGDPTLLLPIFFPEFQKNPRPENEYIVIPHFSDEKLFEHLPNMVSVKEPWEIVVRKILNSQFVVSSALSGVIVAEAFGIPARLLQVENKANTEDLFKYKDYYFGTGRIEFQYASSIEEALEMGGEPLPICDLEKLIQAFPFEKF